MRYKILAKYQNNSLLRYSKYESVAKGKMVIKWGNLVESNMAGNQD